jgi:hypothetical protein
MKAHTFTDTRILIIHGRKSHCGCICVCGRWCGFQIFPISVSVKCSVPNYASQQCFLEVTNFGRAQRCYSKDEVCHPVRWGTVRHSLNMSSVCSTILRHVSMCIIGLLQRISNTVMASCIGPSELVLLSSLAEVVVYLPSKDIVGNDVSPWIFLIWMIFLRHESVHTFGLPRDFRYCAYLSLCSSDSCVRVCVCICIRLYVTPIVS